MLTTGDHDPDSLLAIVGLAGRFPGAEDIDSLWTVLKEGRDCITEVPDSRWDSSTSPDPSVAVPDQGGFLEGVEMFDPLFFGISPREAESIDPQQRQMLEVFWRTLEDSGTTARALRRTRTGVYVGALWHDFETGTRRGPGDNQFTAVGQALDVIAARWSYFLGLRGPSMSVQTGCSSSLVAFDLAVSAIREGRIESAFVGGVNLMLGPDDSVSLTHFGGLSPDGRCKSFSADANGFVRAEGVVGVYLKRYVDAVRDGDRIHAVVVGSGTNNDGGGDSLAAPSPDGQVDLLETVYGGAGVDPTSLSYVETHGTGTFRGDPIEAGSVGRALASRRDPAAGALPIGSVKSNIGHLESAAGLAGLVKAALILRHRMIPPSIHSAELNPTIDFDGLRLTVPQECIELSAEGPLYVGVNSFGWGGTNAHVILMTPPCSGEATETWPAAGRMAGSPAVVPVSAHTQEAFDVRLGQLEGTAAALSDHELASLEAAAGTRRDHFALRGAVVAGTADELRGRLPRLGEDEEIDLPRIVCGRATDADKVCFVFPGQGSQWQGMGADLLDHEPVFRATIDRCAEVLAPLVDWDLHDLLRGVGETGLDKVEVIQPALWAMGLGLAELWRHNGVDPDVVIGHSQGEVTAATFAGALSYADAAKIMVVRSSLAARATGHGRMLAVDLDLEAAESALEGFEDSVAVAVNNGPSSCVLAGDEDSIEILRELLEAEGTFCRLVDVDYASHCHHMDPLLDPLVEQITGITPRECGIDFLSTVRAGVLGGAELGPGYWAENLRSPVLFHGTLGLAHERGVTHVVEISPHPGLSHALRQRGDEDGTFEVLSTLRRGAGTAADFATARARAYVAGLEPFAPAPAGDVELAGTPWQQTLCRREGGSSTRRGDDTLRIEPAPADPDTVVASTSVSTANNPWVVDHRVHDAVVMPGTGMLGMVVDAARAHLGTTPGALVGVTFGSDLTLRDDEPRRVDVVIRQDATTTAGVELLSLGEGELEWTLHCTGRIEYERGASRSVNVPEADQDGVAEFYDSCARRGLQYGPAFRGIVGIRHDGDLVTTRLEAPAETLPTLRDGVLHPAMWDAALQACLAHVPDVTVVPTAIHRIDLDMADEVRITSAHASARRTTDGGLDLEVIGDDGRVLVAMQGVELTVLEAGDSVEAVQATHRTAFEETSPVGTADLVEKEVAFRAIGGVTASKTIADAVRGRGARVTELGASPDPDLVLVLVPASVELDDAERAISEIADSITAMASSTPSYVLVTEGAQPGPGTDKIAVAGGLFWGFTRVFRREHPGFRARVIDVEPGLLTGSATAEAIAALVDELGAGTADQVSLRGGLRRRAVIVSDDDPEPPARGHRPAGKDFRLVPHATGRTDLMEFTPRPRLAPAAGEIEIDVEAVSLNFIDVMKAVGTYPDASAGADLLGGECVGTVVRVGDTVDPALIGTRRAACVFGSLAGRVTVDRAHTVAVPDGMPVAHASAISLVAATAWYGLVDLAEVEAGKTVLIHSAAGGLGQAAVALARHRGATVIATAGTPDKREMLRAAGIVDVFDSRELDWERQVLECTGGAGVDVVLNSLTGAALDAGMRVLAEGGRFVEVGKKDIYSGRRIPLTAFERGISVHAVDMAGLMSRRPDRFAQVLASVWELVRMGVFEEIEVSTFPMSEAGEVLREFGTGRHIGKIVLDRPESVTEVACEPMPGGAFNPDGVYLVTGGLGALGLSLVEHMAGRGATRFALLGRSDPSPEALDRMAALTEQGVEVTAHATDVSDHDALAAVLRAVREGAGPIRGVVHAAGVLDDATILSMTPQQVSRVVAPKVRGALLLDELTSGDPVDLFVLFSSIAGLVGNPGQAAYAAANTALDSLAWRRRSTGRPALSIQWGPVSDVGLATEGEVRGSRLSERGLLGFPVSEAWPAMERALRDAAVVTSYAPLDVRQWFDSYPETAALESWDRVAESSGDPGEQSGNDGFRELARTVAGEDLLAAVEETVRELAAKVLRLDSAAVDPRVPFKAIGLDSLMGLELRARLEKAFGLRFSPTLLWTYGDSRGLSTPISQMLVAAVAADATV